MDTEHSRWGILGLLNFQPSDSNVPGRVLLSAIIVSLAFVFSAFPLYANENDGDSESGTGIKEHIENVERAALSAEDYERLESAEAVIHENTIRNYSIIIGTIVVLLGGLYWGWRRMKK